MIASPAQVLSELLIALGLATRPSVGEPWPITTDSMPDAPDKAVVCVNTAGVIDGRLMEGGEYIEHPGVQIRTRAGVIPDSYAKSYAIKEALKVIDDTVLVISDYSYKIANVSRRTPIIYLGQEQGRTRFIHSVNLLVSIKEVLV